MSGWERYFFKGKNDNQPKKVWVEVDDEGQLQRDDGLARMKYDNSEEAKVYNASPANLTPIAKADKPENTEPELKPGEIEVRRGCPASVDPPSMPDGVDILIYTDGATSSATHQGSGPTGIGVVFWDGKNYKELSQPLGRATNQVAELAAIRQALEEIRTPERSIVLRTDSQYAQKSLTQWIHNWKRNGWQNSSGQPVSNQSLIKEISRRMEDFKDLKIEWVEGHAGEELNERADELAVRAVEKC